MLAIIAAITAGRGAIGRRGDLLFHISDDLKHFKEITTGATVVMGRKTFESLPKGALPNRRNVVITRNTSFSAPGAEMAHSLEEALALTADDPRVYVIGGGEIYRQALEAADKMFITLIEAPEPDDADTFFPPIDPSQWQMTELGNITHDTRSGIPYRFVEFSRNK